MRRIDQIDFNKSIEKHTLIYKEEWVDTFQTIFLFFTLIAGASLFFIIVNNPNAYPNDKIFGLIIFVLIVLLFLYIIYRRLREAHLIEIKTNSDKKTNRQLIIEYFNKQSFKLQENSSDYLIFNEEQSYSGYNSFGKSVVVLIQDNSIFFTILKSDWRLDIPVLTSHLFLRHDLKKLLNQGIA